MSSLTVRPAARQSARLLIGLFGESGSGKTKSALLLARGIAGPSGKVIMGDTESGRGEFFADEIPGGYEVIPMDSPFSPARGIEMLELMEAKGATVGIIDSCSHFWEGIGGVLDMAAENEEAGKKALAIWRKPKFEHQQFVLKLLQAKMTVIVCLRAKFKSRQVKDGGKTTIVRDDYLTPLQAEDFLFELTLHMQVNPNHSIIVTKKGRADLRACLPDDNSDPLAIRHGEAIATWARGGSAPGPQSPPAPATSPEVRTLKKKLFQMTQGEHGGDQEKFYAFLLRKEAITPAENEARQFDEKRLADIIDFVEGLA